MIPATVASPTPRANRARCALIIFPPANLEILKATRKHIKIAITHNRVILLKNTAKRRNPKTAPTIPRKTARKSRIQPNIKGAILLRLEFVSLIHMLPFHL